MRSTELVISLPTLQGNYRVMRSACKSPVMAVVKADAYGHGLVETARALSEVGARAFAVAIPEEALALREAGIPGMILILGRPCDLPELVANRVSFALFDEETLKLADQAAENVGQPALAHLKLDTGMRRIGTCAPDSLLEAWRNAKNVVMEGCFSHLAAADSDESFTQTQRSRFEAARQKILAAGFRPIFHLAATTAFQRPEFAFDMTRPGVVLYGSGDTGLPVRPAQRLTTRPVRIETIEGGESVGYSRAYRAEGERKIMTVPIGYGDGYPRALSNRGFMLVSGRRAPIAGNVCMDMTMLDVTGIPDVSMNSEVVVMGDQAGESITPDEIARWANTISYEIMLGFSPRVRRRYVRT